MNSNPQYAAESSINKLKAHSNVHKGDSQGFEVLNHQFLCIPCIHAKREGNTFEKMQVGRIKRDRMGDDTPCASSAHLHIENLVATFG